MSVMRFCESCGAELPPGSGHARQCSACGHVRYLDASPCGAALVVRDDRALLLVRRAQEPWRGCWDIPGGHCDGPEHPAAAARREVFEEAGVDVRVTGFLGLWTSADHPQGRPSLTAYYHARPHGSTTLAPEATETLEAAWHPFDELPEDIAFPAHQRAVLNAWRAAQKVGDTTSALRDRQLATLTPKGGDAGPQAILFDVGGVLLLPDGQRLASRLRRSGIAADDERAADALFAASAQAARHRDPATFWSQEIPAEYAHHAGIPAGDAERAWQVLEELDATDPDLWTRRVEGLEDTLGELTERGLRLAVVSNANGRLRDELQDRLLDGYFDAVVDSHSLGIEKPDARVFHSAVAALGLEPEACWFVGDDPHYDLEGAVAAGMGRMILLDRLDVHPDVAGCTRITQLSGLISLLDEDAAP